ncbi:MAG: hypothetical protein JXA00_02835 [Candidatus Thermoplasmatota archaeon]|nr:hypothetical protein [Candidatus Thermoplasmatota archaeon]
MKRIYGLFLVVLFLSPVLRGVTVDDGQPEFEVTFLDRRARELRIAITNSGDADAYNVSWLMYYPQPLPLCILPNPNMMEGTIAHLPVGSSYIVSTGPMFGFHLQGAVQVYVGEYCLFHGTKNIIGFTVVDPWFIRYENDFFTTPDGLSFGVTEGTRTEIRAFIQNTATESAHNVHWTIELSLFPGNSRPMTFNGTIDRLDPEERVFVSPGSLHGFHLWADVFVYVNNYGPAHGYQHIIGPYVIFPRYMPNH